MPMPIHRKMPQLQNHWFELQNLQCVSCGCVVSANADVTVERSDVPLLDGWVAGRPQHAMCFIVMLRCW